MAYKKAGGLVSAKLNAEELSRVEKIAKAAGMTPAQWVHDLVVGTVAQGYAKAQTNVSLEMVGHDIELKNGQPAGWAEQFEILEKVDPAERSKIFGDLAQGRKLPEEWKGMTKETRIGWLNENWPFSTWLRRRAAWCPRSTW